MLSNRSTFAAVLTGGVSLLALGVVQPVMAQAQSDQPSASSSSGLEEIVVTARRKEEKAQSVPIAISSVSAASLDEQRILAPSEFMKDTTGFSACCSASRSIGGTSVGGSFGNGYQWIRGIPGVIPYWADVPTITSSGLFFDTGSIQVLKGPQGTLFGQATNGGAIQFQPRMPTNSFEGFVEAEVGDYGHSRLAGIVNIPVIDDKLLVRLGGSTIRTDGFVYDVAHKTWLGDENSWDGRLAVTIRPTDDLQIDTIGNAFSYSDHPFASQYRYISSSVVGATYAGNPNACTNAACGVTFGGPLGWYAVPGNSQWPTAAWETGHEYNIVNTVRWDLSDSITIKNISGYVEYGPGKSYNPAVINLTVPPPAAGLPYNNPTGAGFQGSEELQILGKAFDDKFAYTAGTFYLYNTGNSAPHPIQYTCFSATRCSGSVLYATDRVNAVYAQGTYDFGDFVEGLSFTGGVRYTWDRAYGSVYSYNLAQVAVAGFGQGEASKAASYSMSLDWQIDPKTLVYITNSKGFSKGGINLTATLPAGDARTFAPESLSNVELGVKADWDLPLDMKARTNVSVFYGFYDNIQASLNTPIVDALGNVSSSVVTKNAATGHLDGIDFELTLLPVTGVQLSGGGVWVEDKYDTYPYCTTRNAVGTCTATADFTPSVFVITPKWTWHVRLAYELPLDESIGKITFAANMSHIGPYWGSVGFPYPPLQNRNPATNNVDLSVSWQEFLGRTGLDARTYVTNLMNDHYGQGGVPTYAANGLTNIPVGMPRAWGVNVKYSFGP